MSVQQLPTRTRERTDPAWLREWREAEVVERAEAAHAPRPPARWIAGGFALGIAASLAVLAPTLFSFSPGYTDKDTAAQVIAAILAAAVAVAIVPLAASIAARTTRIHQGGLGSLVLFGVSLLSVGAAAIHFAVAKSHFEEYTLYGVFFVLSGAAQLVWPLILLFRPTRALLLVGAIGNLLIGGLWAVDRMWGLPLGPEPWKPETVGFADSASTAFEILIALGCFALLATPLYRRMHARVSGRAAVLLTLAVTAPTVLGLLSAMGAVSTFLTPSG